MDYTIFTRESASGPVFCDWLDVTCSPDSSFVDSVRQFLDRLCCEVKYSDDFSSVVSVGSGVLRLDTNPKWHRASASGKVLSYLRESGSYPEYLHLLSEVPHTITRLDAACDYNLDTPAILDSLDSAYPDDRISFSRKALTITRLLSKRQDGKLTGTWYAGHRQKAKVSARIYDKAAEVAAKTGLYFLSGCTRVEITARKSYGACLRDAYDPECIYYAMGDPAFFKRPADVAPWASVSDFTAWVSPDYVDPLPFEVFRRRVNRSSELDHLADLASELGPCGVDLAVRVFREKLRSKLNLSLGGDGVGQDDNED